MNQTQINKRSNRRLNVEEDFLGEHVQFKQTSVLLVLSLSEQGVMACMNVLLTQMAFTVTAVLVTTMFLSTAASTAAAGLKAGSFPDTSTDRTRTRTRGKAIQTKTSLVETSYHYSTDENETKRSSDSIEANKHLSTPASYSHQRGETKNHGNQADSSNRLNALETENYLSKIDTEDNIDTNDTYYYNSTLPITNRLSNSKIDTKDSIDTNDTYYHKSTLPITTRLSATRTRNRLDISDSDNPYSLATLTSEDRRFLREAADDHVFPPITDPPQVSEEYLNLTSDQLIDCLGEDGQLQISAKQGQLAFFKERHVDIETSTAMPGEMGPTSGAETGTASSRDYWWCKLIITAPQDHIWRMHFAQLFPEFCSAVTIFVSDIGSQRDAYELCGFRLPVTRYSASNKVFLILRVLNIRTILILHFFFNSVPISSRPQLELHYESSSHGYIQTPEVDGRPAYETLMNSWVGARVPDRHTVMLSFTKIEPAEPVDLCSIDVYLYIGGISENNFEARLCGFEPPGPAVYNTDQFYVQIKSDYTNFRLELKKGLKVFFSFHNETSQPQRLQNGKWNCSVPYWSDFRQHFPCNLVAQCLKGEDEAGCFYTTAECGEGFFSAGGSCFAYNIPDREVSWYDASNECLRGGTQLASLNTAEQWREVVHLISRQNFFLLHVGRRTVEDSLPRMYHTEWRWLDGTVDHFKRTPSTSIRHSCTSFWTLASDSIFLAQTCDTVQNAHFLCEKDIELSLQTSESLSELKSIVLKDILDTFATNNLNRTGVLCPKGHATHSYLACDVDSACWGQLEPLEKCNAPLDPLPPSFTCRSQLDSVPYPLVCDHRPDCKDDSDEDFCVYPPCAISTSFYCNAQQCVPHDKFCDGQGDCYNDADEDSCRNFKDFTTEEFPPPPGLISLDKTGHFAVHTLQESGNETTVQCPATHFRCVHELFYCLPVHLRCNDVYDCPSHEDEDDCDTYTCPGYYRCRDSRVCVHPDHVCDHIYHCPQHDDELLCDLQCPEQCLCYGTAFFCSAAFRVDLYPELRFLEARATEMTPADLTNSTMLIHLGLARCSLTRLEVLNLPNLHSLDLSDNDIVSIRQEHLSLLPNLYQLSLAGNPLTSSLFTEHVSQRAFQSVKILDMSRVYILKLNTSIFTAFITLKLLNLSGNGIQAIMDDGLNSLADLRLLDLRGSPITEFPPSIFRDLSELQTVFADNYKLCCPVNLPTHFNPAHCHAPVDEISSCDNLLRSNMYRAFLAVFAVLALLGNLGSFFFRVIPAKRRAVQAFGVFVTHLCVADFLMGVYLAVIGVADRLYQGTYVWEDEAWRTSAFCRLVGFLSLLSSEVSAFIICLITLDRFLVLRFPFSQFRFRKASAHGACLAVWALGILLAAVPLLPRTSHWEFYSQTGICIPLPITRKVFPGQSYSFAVMILLNFVLFLFIALGQVFIYWSIRSNAMADADAGKRSRDLTIASRLLTVAMSDFLCWFPIGVLGLAASAGHRIPGEVNVAMAIFVLPFNSALNPFLYTLNMVMERRARAREERLTAILVSRLKSARSCST